MLLTGALAESTKKKYAAIQQKFLDFCADLRVLPCPCSTETVLRFLAWGRQSQAGGGAPGVLAALRNLHTMNGANPKALDDPRIAQARLTLARDIQTKEERAPLTSDDLKRIFASLSDGTEGNRMVKAALSLGFFGLLRVADFTSFRTDANPPLTLDSLTWRDSFLEVKLWRSKADRTQRGSTISIPKTGSLICPFEAMKKYLEVRPVAACQSLFLWPSGAPLTSSGFRTRLLSECRRAGLKGNLNGHSLRIGGATALAARGVEVEVIRKLGRWRSDSVRRYLKEPKEVLAKTAGLLDN